MVLTCTALVAATGSTYAVAGFVAVIALISLGCSYAMAETLRSGLREDNPSSGDPPDMAEPDRTRWTGDHDDPA